MVGGTALSPCHMLSLSRDMWWPCPLTPSVLSPASPRFELPMGTTEQPPLPQQTQPPTKVLPPSH